MARILITLLGCDKNRIDAEIIMKKLTDAGHTLAEDPQKSDLALINTCGFIEASKQESIEAVFDMIRLKESGESEINTVVVTGCLAERYREQLADMIPEIDAVVGIGRNSDIVRIVNAVLDGEKTTVFENPEKLPIEGKRILSTPKHYAYLKIAEGCSNRCSYCAIPDIRGKFRSRSPDDVINEAGCLAGEGVKELILVAQDTTAYGRDLARKTNLSELLCELADIDGLWKIRIMYAYPELITDSLIETINNKERIAKYIDIPFQHADAGILKRMGRTGDKEKLLALVKRLREGIPGLTMRSSFIVGFPGEGMREFGELMDFVNEAKIDRAGCFVYSSEEGTPAYQLKGRVSEKVKKSRAEAFMNRQATITGEKQKEKTGRTAEVLVDRFDDERGMYCGRTESDAPQVDTEVLIKSKYHIQPGDIVKVRITGSDLFDLTGTIKREIDLAQE